MKKIAYCLIILIPFFASCKYSRYIDETNKNSIDLYDGDRFYILMQYPKDSQFDEDSELFIMHLSVAHRNKLAEREKFIVEYRKVDINIFDVNTNRLIQPIDVVGKKQGDIGSESGQSIWYKYANIPEDRNLLLSVKLLLIINDKPYAFDKRIELRRKVERSIQCD